LINKVKESSIIPSSGRNFPQKWNLEREDHRHLKLEAGVNGFDWTEEVAISDGNG
jgi:hypothetical protein